MSIERTFVMIKPDGVQRGLVGEILKRFEQRGMKIVAMKMAWIDSDFSKKHYKEHVDKPFYGELESLITEGPVVAMVIEGHNVVEQARKIRGPTKPEEAMPGTITGDFSHFMYQGRNLAHASSSRKDAQKEIELWFKPDEIHSYKIADEKHVLSN